MQVTVDQVFYRDPYLFHFAPRLKLALMCRDHAPRFGEE
jgi:hypothetical protein